MLRSDGASTSGRHLRAYTGGKHSPCDMLCCIGTGMSIGDSMPPPDCPSMGIPAVRHLIEAKERCGAIGGRGCRGGDGHRDLVRAVTQTRELIAVGSKLNRTVALSQVHESETRRMSVILHAVARDRATSALHSRWKGRPRSSGRLPVVSEEPHRARPPERVVLHPLCAFRFYDPSAGVV